MKYCQIMKGKQHQKRSSRLLNEETSRAAQRQTSKKSTVQMANNSLRKKELNEADLDNQVHIEATKTSRRQAVQEMAWLTESSQAGKLRPTMR